MQLLELRNAKGESFDVVFEDDAKKVTIKQYVDYSTAYFEYFKGKGVNFEGMMSQQDIEDFVLDIQENDTNEYYNNFIKPLVCDFLGISIETADKYLNGETLEILKANIDKVISRVCDLGDYKTGVETIEYEGEIWHLPKLFSDSKEVDLLRQFTTQEVIEVKECQYRTQLLLKKGIGELVYDQDTKQEIYKNRPLNTGEKKLYKLYDYRQMLAIILKKEGEQLPNSDIAVDEFINNRIETVFTESFPAYIALKLDIFFLSFANTLRLILPLNGFFTAGSMTNQVVNMKLRHTQRQERTQN